MNKLFFTSTILLIISFFLTSEVVYGQALKINPDAYSQCQNAEWLNAPRAIKIKSQGNSKKCTECAENIICHGKIRCTNQRGPFEVACFGKKTDHPEYIATCPHPRTCLNGTNVIIGDASYYD